MKKIQLSMYGQVCGAYGTVWKCYKRMKKIQFSMHGQVCDAYDTVEIRKR